MFSYSNVLRAGRKARPHRPSSKQSYSPFILLMPFVVSTGIQLAWLSHPKFNESWIIDSPSFVPFCCAWGLQFAVRRFSVFAGSKLLIPMTALSQHQVGRMILAHTTGTPFPIFDWIWLLSLFGALDANLPKIVGIPPFLQTSPGATARVVWFTLAVSGIMYARFVILVIRDITEYLGIACFRVRKRDGEGVWRSVKVQ